MAIVVVDIEVAKKNTKVLTFKLKKIRRKRIY